MLLRKMNLNDLFQETVRNRCFETIFWGNTSHYFLESSLSLRARLALISLPAPQFIICAISRYFRVYLVCLALGQIRFLGTKRIQTNKRFRCGLTATIVRRYFPFLGTRNTDIIVLLKLFMFIHSFIFAYFINQRPRFITIPYFELNQWGSR